MKLIMKYLDGQELTEEEIRRGLKIAIGKGAIVQLCAARPLEHRRPQR